MSHIIRKSNMELLRIISMALVVALHLNGAWTYVDGYGNFDFASLRGFGLMLYQSVAIVAVNCFILISGFFGIKASKKGFLALLSYIIFYALICYTIGIISGATSLSVRTLLYYFYNFDTHLWFVNTYILLYILSFFLNKGINTLTNRQLSFATFGLIFLDVFYGWLSNGDLGFTSFSINHMICIYLIGRLLSRFEQEIATMSNKLKLITFSIYIFCTLATALSTLKFAYDSPMAYNSPFVIGASVSLFMLFMTLKFQSKAINLIAGSAFGVYLLHHSTYIWWDFLNFSYTMMDYLGEWGYNFFYIPIVIISLFLISFIINQLRIKIATPLINLATKAVNRIEDTFCRIFKIND